MMCDCKVLRVSFHFYNAKILKLCFSRIEFGLDDGYLLHTSGKCVKPVSDRISDGVELGLYDNCNGHKFGFTKGGSIKHLGSGKCIQPREEVCLLLSLVWRTALMHIFLVHSFCFTGRTV